MGLQVTFIAESVEGLHAQMLAMLGRHERDTGCNAPAEPAVPVKAATEVGSGSVGATGVAEDAQPTAEVVPIAERKKPGRPKKAETVVDAEPVAAKPVAVTVEDARAVLSEIKSKIGMEEARQLNKKYGEKTLAEKDPSEWAAIVSEGKTLLAALDAE